MAIVLLKGGNREFYVFCMANPLVLHINYNRFIVDTMKKSFILDIIVGARFKHSKFASHIEQ